MAECKEVFTMVVSTEALGEPLCGLVRKAHQAAADMYADGDIGRVEVYIEGKEGGKVEVRVDGELIDTGTLFV